MMQVHDDKNWSDTWDTYGTSDEQKAYYKQYGLYVDTLQDMRKGLESWRDYLTSEPGNVYTTHQDENQYSGSKALRRVVNDSGYLGYQGQEKGQMRRPTGTTGSEMVQSATENYGDKYTEEGKWVIGEWYKAMSSLYESQKRAGTSMHFDKEFGDKNRVKDGAPSWMSESEKDSLQSNAWRLYVDSTWEIGDVSSEEGLREALRTIEASADTSLVGTHDYRSADQRDYLANKAYVRYLNSKINAMGLTEAKKNWTSVLGYGQVRGSKRASIRQAYEKMEQGEHVNFGFSPEFSYADDYAKWGYHTMPTDLGDGDYMSPDYKIEDDKKHYYTAEPEWLQDFKQYYQSDVDPAQVSGRYKSREDYEKALAHVAQEGPDPIEIETDTGNWDPWDEGVPQNDMPWDAAQGKYVVPAHKTPGSVYNPITQTYEHQSASHAAVDPVRDTVLPVIHEDPMFESFDAGFTPEAGSDYPDGFFWNANQQKVVSPDGDSFDLGDSAMWDAYWKLAMPLQPPQPAPAPPEPVVPEPVAPEQPAAPPKQTIPDHPDNTGAHVHEVAELPRYMQEAHEDLVFQHTDAPLHLPKATKVV